MDPVSNPTKRIAIVGLGYVGLPLGIQFARSNVSVLGLDIDEAKVNAINNGESYIRHIAPKTISEVLKAGRLRASTDFSTGQCHQAWNKKQAAKLDATAF